MKRLPWFMLTLVLLLLAQTACTFSASVIPTPMDPTPTSPGATLPVATDIGSFITPEVEGCPATDSADAKLYRNDEDGYCLLYPQNFTLVPPRFIVLNPVMRGDKAGDAWVDILVEPANGRSAEQVANDAIAAAGEGFNLQMDQFVVDDTRAFVVDGLPGPDPLRNVYVVSNDRLYTFTFMPWGNSRELETLYDWTMKSLHFLP